MPKIFKQLGFKQFLFMKDFHETLKQSHKNKKPKKAFELLDFDEVS